MSGTDLLLILSFVTGALCGAFALLALVLLVLDGHLRDAAREIRMARTERAVVAQRVAQERPELLTFEAIEEGAPPQWGA